ARAAAAAAEEQLTSLKKQNAEQTERIDLLKSEIQRLDERYQRELARREKDDDLMRAEMARFTERYQGELSRKERLEDSMRAEIEHLNRYRTGLSREEPLRDMIDSRGEQRLTPRRSLIERIANMTKFMRLLSMLIALTVFFVGGLFAYKSY